MKEFKMSDNFYLPLHTSDYCYAVYDTTGEQLNIDCNGLEDYVVYAINSHDKLTEQNKMLREFIKSMKIYGADDIRRMILLEDTK